VWETVSFLVVQSLVLFTAPVAGIVLGVRAALSGNRAAAVAAVVAAVGLVVLLFLGLSGGWLDTTPSVRM
jgi:hypothetical protein